MSIVKKLEDITDEELVEICDNFTSASEYLLNIGVSARGQYSSIINKKRTELNLEWKLKANRIVDKECPVCNKTFKPGTKEQVTCSYSCSNTHFRSGSNNGSYKAATKNYRTRCFEVHDKKCVVCGEDKIVAVHHYDENHDNNDIENLIPLCPTHHQYVHSRYREEVQPTIDAWREEFLRGDRINPVYFNVDEKPTATSICDEGLPLR